MLKLDSIGAFVYLAEAGSVTAAARRLGISKSVASERIASLERSLGAKLVHRTTRHISLTEEGRVFYARAKGILQEVERASAEVGERRGTLAGPLRISAPVSFGSLHLGPALFAFLAQHPEIELTLELDDRFVNILNDGYDAVIRHGPVDDKRIIVKRLASSRRVLVASPEYLKRAGKPANLADLGMHKGIIYSNRGAADWRFRTGRKFSNVQPAVALRVNNGLLMRDAAIAGRGVALLPMFLLHTALKERALVEIDVGAEAEGATIHIAYAEHLRTSAKIRAMSKWLLKSFGGSELPWRR